MYDILDLLHVDTKEDVYTFCLREFLENSEEFRALSRKRARYGGLFPVRIFFGRLNIQ